MSFDGRFVARSKLEPRPVPSLRKMLPQGDQLLKALNVTVIGSGSRVIIVTHGFGANQSAWDSLLPSLVKMGKVVLLDWPGAGTTNPDDFDFSVFESYSGYADSLLGVLEVLRVERCTFLGHSMSGMIACIAATKKPEVFDKLVLLSASPRYLNGPDYHGGFEQTHIDQMFEAIRTDLKGWAAGFAQLLVGVDDKHAIDKYEKSLLEMRPDVILTLAKNIFLSDYRDLLPQVKTRVHILQTSKDNAVPMVVANYMRDNFGSKATLEVVLTEGHIPHSTAPDVLMDSLQNVLMSE